ncbi:MAG: murein biosynthesis integral membrane protein MurJ, partial [Pseudomonadota bacterium]
VLLYAGLHRTGRYRLTAITAGRVAKQVAAAAAMALLLWYLRDVFDGFYAANVFRRIVGIGALVGGGLLAYAVTLLLVGGVDRAQLAKLRRSSAN